MLYKELKRPLAARRIPMEQLLRDESLDFFHSGSARKTRFRTENSCPLLPPLEPLALVLAETLAKMSA
jgi:hypothetical protein